MSAGKRWRLICYDIRDAGRWREVYKLVSGHSRRVQYSVYRARLDDLEVERLRLELASVMDAEDSLLIVDLCPTCASKVISRNHIDGWQERPATFYIVGGRTIEPDHGSIVDAALDSSDDEET